MAVEDGFYNLAPHTVTITPTSSRNEYGEVLTTGTVRTARAYVDPTVSFSQGSQRDETTRPVTAIILDTGITVTDVITLPDGTTPEIETVAVYDSSFIVGMEHSVVRFR